MLKQRFAVQFGSQFGIKILGMIAGLIVARVAGPEVVGVLAFGTAYISIWGFIMGLFGSGHIKLISEGQDFGDCLTTYTWLKAGSLLLYSLIVLGLFSYHRYFAGEFFESKTQETVILILLIANIFNQVLNFGNSTFTAKLEQAKANYPLVVKAIVFHLARVVIVFLGLRAVGLATVNLISALLVLPLAWSLIKKLEFGNFNKDFLKKYIGYGLPILLIVVINSVMEYADKLLLAHYTDTKELGFYSAAFSIGGMFLLITNSVGNIFFPLFSNLIAEKNWKGVNDKIGNYQVFVALFFFPLVCWLILIGAPFFTTLLGERYYPSVVPFKILLIATYISIVGIPYGNVINGMGKFYINALINLICLVVFLVSIFLLVNPKYFGLGATGIAINLVVINLTRNVLYLLFSFRLGQMQFRTGVMPVYLIVGAITALALFLEPRMAAWTPYWWLIISPVFIGIIYLVLYQLGFFAKSNMEQLMDTLNIKKLVAYLKEELGSKK
jgi:O-antigen/teichoic acid export membrane protein